LRLSDKSYIGNVPRHATRKEAEWEFVMPERIYIVGHSALTCLGRDMETTWRGLITGKSGIRRQESLSSDQFLQDIAGRVPDEETDSTAPADAQDASVAKLGARFLPLSLQAARDAWSDAGLNRDGIRQTIDPDRVSVVIGSAFGGVDLLEAEQARMARRRNPAVSPFMIPGLVINQAVGQIAEKLGLYGPSVAPANACASGGHSIILGAMFLRSGEADLALCGAGESAFIPAIVNGFATMKALLGRKVGDRSLEDPAQASRPFSQDRAGFVLSEGAGMVVLATQTTLTRLGLEPQAELLGWAINSDGYHMAMPCGDRIGRCLKRAMAHANRTPDDIDYYNAHGTSTVVNDQVETQVLKDVLGERARKIPVSSIKGALGHSLGAASAIEAAACVRSLREQIIPPTINHQADPLLDLDYVPDEARPARLETILSASFGFGGTNNILVLGRPKP
jgi:3-oxoacyl-[acyl-carrier-protein] synthase II